MRSLVPAMSPLRSLLAGRQVMIGSPLTRAIYLMIGLEVAMPEVELSAGAIEYEDTGGSGPAIVFVHGLIMDGSLWRHVVGRPALGLPLCAPTLPLGAHRRPMHADADLSMRGMAEILGEFIEPSTCARSRSR